MLKRLEDTLAAQQGEDELKVVPVSDLGLLAGNRADLVLLQRQITERLADKKDWRIGLARLQASTALKGSSYGDVDLDDERDSATDRQNPTSEMTSDKVGHDSRGVLYSTLLDALASLDDFLACYERLTNKALGQCALGLRLKSVERLVADLAVMTFDKGDPTTAANYLGRIIPSFAAHNWSLIETELVKIHAQCLRKLNRKDGYVRMALSILAKAAAHRKASLQLSVGSRLGSSDSWLDDEKSDSQDILRDLLSVSEELPCDVIVPMSDFFVDISVDPFIEHFKDKDGFSMVFKFRHLFGDLLAVDALRMKLKCTDPPFREIWLESPKALELGSGISRIKLEAQVC
jgi:hypothetical protein